LGPELPIHFNETLFGGVAITAVVLLVVGLIWLVGWMDRDRIREYIASRRGELLETSWSPFGPGWFARDKQTIYFVRYLDGDGNEHEAYCKTGLFSGVYFTQDEIVKYLKPPQSVSALQAENERLRHEIEMLRRKQETS
jgi:hypothetical protein